ncbi:MAG: GDSL-type esterase/lipase family protein [Flavobacteriales bacterium]|jgi:lysophospholipase L1-like esterase|nr:GDSL-type esterase/lipase family protein [Flavobacteriales bacterium]
MPVVPFPPLRTSMAATLLGMALVPAHAQPDPVRVPAPTFVDRAANTIVQPGDSSGMNAWHAQLDRLFFHGEGQVNVVHIGGSHIQADMWSNHVRHRLQHTAPGVRAARGFIFPFSLARTNNPYWYLPEATGTWTAVRNVTRADTSILGLAGISVTSRDTLSELRVSFRGEVYAGYTFQQVRVLHSVDSSFAVEAWDPDTTVRISADFDPDEGLTTFRYDRHMDTLRLRFRRTDSTQTHITLHGIVLDTDDPGFVYHAIGVNGASTRSYLRCQLFTAHLAQLRPDLVVFSIGVNDAHDADFSKAVFKRNYAALIDRVRQAAPDAAILLTTNTDSYHRRRVVNRNGAAVRAAMLELGRERGVAVWDLYTVMGGPGSIAQWEKAGLAKKDRIHFNRAGYTLLADLQTAALMEAYGAHLKHGTGPRHAGGEP